MTAFKGGEPTTDKSAEELTALGYCVTSRAYGLVSRIDRPDWLEHIATEMRRAPADFIVRDGSGRPSGQWCDYYRRVYSKDTHTVDPERLKQIPSSSFESIGHVETGHEPARWAMPNSTEKDIG